MIFRKHIQAVCKLLFQLPCMALPLLAETPAPSPSGPIFRRADTAIASLDPIQASTSPAGRAVLLVYETLLQYDYRARPYTLRPYAAAEMPALSSDGRTLTFRLRDDVYFGPDPCFQTPDHRRKCTAEDVVFSLHRLANAQLSSPGYWLVADKIEGIREYHEATAAGIPAAQIPPISGLRALDAQTLEIRLTRPDPEFLWGLALPYCAIVPREAVAAYGKDFGLREAGSGPFRLEEWRRGYRMRFARREARKTARDFPPPPAPSETPYAGIEFLLMADPSTRWLSFLRGTFDLATEISRDNWDAVLDENGQLRKSFADRGVRLVSKPALESCYLGFNMDDPVVGKNKKLRQALSCAFDSNAWVELNRGRVSASSTPIPPGIDGRLSSPHPYGYNLEKAKKLLAEAGYPGGIDPATGRRLKLTLMLGRSDQESREGAELMASFFEKIGVLLELDVRTFPNFIASVSKREAQLFQLTWVADYPDAANFLQLFASRFASPGPNRANYANPQYDALFDRLSQTSDPAERRTLAGKMQDIIREDVPWICLYYRNDIVLLSPALRGFQLHDFPMGMEKHWQYAESP